MRTSRGLVFGGLAVLLAVALAPAVAQQRLPPPRANPRTAAEREVPFRAGEQLGYDITWSSFVTATAATATISVREKRAAYSSPAAYYIVAEGRPTPLVAAFYSLYYKVDSWLDAYTLLPLRASIYSQEGAQRENKVTTFNQARRWARYEEQEGSSPARARNVPLAPNTQDALSVFYALRAAPLKMGARMVFPVVFDGTPYQLDVKVGGTQTVRTKAGARSAWRITPTLMAGGRPVESPRGMTLWISDDAQRLPLQMQVDLAVGRFVLTLVSAR